MRRQDKEITNRKLLESILNRAKVCRIALSDGDKPYIIPMNFGFKNNNLYLHSAPEGDKIEILRRNSNICFEVDIKTKLLTDEKACNWSMRYCSVVGFGKASFVDDFKEKTGALDIIMEKYAPHKIFKYDNHTVDALTILKVKITSLTGKKSGFL